MGEDVAAKAMQMSALFVMVDDKVLQSRQILLEIAHHEKEQFYLMDCR
jgi:hypothetical protein